MEQSVASTEYIMALIAFKKNGQYANPTADTIEMSFPVFGEDPVDWFAGSWETDSSSGSPRYYARCLIGPDGGEVALDKGKYEVYLRVTDSPETPVRKVGVLVIF